MGSFLSSLFFSQSIMLDQEAKALLYDPNSKTNVDQFLLNLKFWAMDPSAEFEESLSFINVECIMHNKVLESPEHEYLIIKTVDRENIVKYFILERMMSNLPGANDLPAGEVLRGTKLLKRMKELANSICSSDESALAALERGSPISDNTCLTSVESLKVVSDTLTKVENLAIDRFLGESMVYDKRWHAQNVQYFKPNDLTLFQLAIVADVIHKLFPNYTSLDKHCYFYAGLVYAVAQQIGGIRPLINADETKDDVYHIDKHLFDKFGRWNGLKVADVDAGIVTSVVKIYKQYHTLHIASVSSIL